MHTVNCEASPGRSGISWWRLSELFCAQSGTFLSCITVLSIPRLKLSTPHAASSQPETSNRVVECTDAATAQSIAYLEKLSRQIFFFLLSTSLRAHLWEPATIVSLSGWQRCHCANSLWNPPSTGLTGRRLGFAWLFFDPGARFPSPKRQHYH